MTAGKSSCGGIILDSESQATSSATISWTASKETLVNATGGGYTVFYGPNNGWVADSACSVDVPYTSTSTTLTGLYNVPYALQIRAYGKLQDGTTVSSAKSTKVVVSTSGISSGLVGGVVSGLATESKPEPKLIINDKNHRKDQILLKISSSASAERIDTIYSLIGIQRAQQMTSISEEYKTIRGYLATGVSVTEAMARARQIPEVLQSQPSFLYKTSVTPTTDPQFGQQWALQNSGQTVSSWSNGSDQRINTSNPGSSGSDLNLPKAWDYNTSCTAKPVAVIDTGIYLSHEDLSANLSSVNVNHGTNVVGVGSTNPNDDAGHGTHVAGTIGARGDNAKGGSGVCWQANLMAVKALAGDGTGDSADIAEGITWATSNGAKVINMSLGGYGADSATEAAIANARSNGVLIVVAAGNDGVNNDVEAGYPCTSTYDNVICVAATDQRNQLATFSNYGKISVDIGAPGVNILSTWATKDVTGTVTTSSWTDPNTNRWAQALSLSPYGVSTTALAYPSNWNFSNTYAVSRTDAVYKDFAMSGSLTSVDIFEFEANAAWSLANDSISIWARKGGGNPFALTSSDPDISVLDTLTSTSSSNGASLDLLYYYKTTDCFSTGTCSIGLQMNSGAATVSTGIALAYMYLTQRQYKTDQYMIINGTSMASPHVAGLASLVWSYNPNWSYSQVRTALLSAGKSVSALSGKTVTGMVADAYQSIIYLDPPTGISGNLY